jgi:hypothetical protein
MTGRRLLAQVNVARMRAAADSAEMHGFLSAVDPVNRRAEASAGFVWRLPAGGGHAVTTVEDAGFASVVNVSLWASYESLHAFVYRSHHGGFVRQRARWFLPTPQPSTALWWVAADDRPTVDDALARLRLLRRHGPTASAFSLRRRFDAEGRPVTRPVGIDRRR